MKRKTRSVNQSLEFIQLATHSKLEKVELGNIERWLKSFYDGAKSDGIIETMERKLHE